MRMKLFPNFTRHHLITHTNYSTVVPFYHYKGKRTCKICQSITLYNLGLTRYLLKEDKAKTKCSGIINPLFGVLVDNTCGHLTHCSHFT